ncbi:MAG: hypothetical protein ABIF10_07200 [Candidatus Woesearchaeota archaeon]
MRQNKFTRDHFESEAETMTAPAVYMLMEQGADFFGLWEASKSDIFSSYAEQIWR